MASSSLRACLLPVPSLLGYCYSMNVAFVCEFVGLNTVKHVSRYKGLFTSYPLWLLHAIDRLALPCAVDVLLSVNKLSDNGNSSKPSTTDLAPRALLTFARWCCYSFALVWPSDHYGAAVAVFSAILLVKVKLNKHEDALVHYLAEAPPAPCQNSIFSFFTFALWHEPSVCRLSSVTLLHLTQRLELFGNFA